MTNPEDTIVAISTPPGEGGVGIVRLSGKDAIPIAAAAFRSSRGRRIEDGNRQVYHGHIVDAAGAPLDEVLCHVMRAPNSYTREDVVEINGHGGPAPLNAILEILLARGARLAAPGEFTLRAFLNGRIDLVQAEAVIDQIRARTRANLQAANAAASGALSRNLYAMSDRLRILLARVEAAVDFPEDDLGDLLDQALLDDAATILRDMEALLATSHAGRLYREGAAAAIAGVPNAGKSSLFNLLLRDARAIVSERAGTTRDRIEEFINLAGLPLKLVDTAGVRQTEDEIERIGVQIARDVLKSAQIALLVVDGAAGAGPDDYALMRELKPLEIPIVLVVNKCDLVDAPRFPDWRDEADHCVALSALTGEGLEQLENTLAEILLRGVSAGADEALINRLHQQDSLRRATECLARFLADTTVSPEFLALELQEALHALGEITGETTPDDILANIFGAFCIGK
ncbi:MAG: tRNA uridine-5-carboxymethylaminomethyl(34) synthesis GTPase MnmE [Candidatus Hydrogenedentes bacterium]|nr:tRNA uridine-5-carboxymethylaminomethyl(34) synthesis GTPase MnmE [Candidatus Hydrogenedentota bacterium]